MKKYLLIASSFMLASPLVLAQDTPSPSTPTTPATPAIPATPADPATPGQKTDKEGTKNTDAKAPRASGSANTNDGSLGATANPNSQQGKAKGGMSGQLGDFASFDANGDGKLSRDEAKANSSISFTEMDRNSDGNISRGEFESGARATPPKGETPVPPKTERR